MLVLDGTVVEEQVAPFSADESKPLVGSLLIFLAA